MKARIFQKMDSYSKSA
ncbi:hypothetical protein Goari_018160 [Gossypium aridum]|uniref:Uncharacterized protein n=1 Tax=Gossypium aridum TaxID=34290 RepID=A0A7J8WP19_GOSAI|nr:hypothetical protein [Gossypium aridum]